MNPPKAALVSYYPNILHVARLLAAEADKEPRKAIAAIVMSAASVEGFVNELLERMSFRHGAPKQSAVPRKVLALGRLAEELDDRNASVHLKVQLMVGALRGSPWDRGAQPYQDFDLLFKLRNALVHSRPEALSEAEFFSSDPHPLLRRLHDRVPLKWFESPKMRSRLLGVAMGVQSPGVAQWSYDTCVRTCLALADCLPRSMRASARSTITGNKQRVKKPV